MKEEFPVGQPEDVVDFKNFLNSLDFFASFFIKEKRRGRNNFRTVWLLSKSSIEAWS
jgi:hypothetical protein